MTLRGSLEFSDDLQSARTLRQLLPWLVRVGCEDELDPIEREQLEAPLGRLSTSQRVDTGWAGEAATFFGWMLKLTDAPQEAQRADTSNLVEQWRILSPEAGELIQRACFRDGVQIEDMCRHFMLVLSIMRESRVTGPAREILRRMSLDKLNALGVVVTKESLDRASNAVSRMTADEREAAAGLYFVRDHAATWFLSDQGTYFA